MRPRLRCGPTAAACDEQLKLHTFRTRGGLAVDFIARFGRALWAIEAKASSHASGHDAASLLAAKAYLPKDTRLVLVTPSGTPRRMASGVSIMALADLLSAVAAPGR